MLTVEDARRLALALPEVTEQGHHGFPSFRVEGRIFATLPDAERLHVMVDYDDTCAAVAEDPIGCEELWWGKRLRGVHVHLGHADPVLVAEMLDAAWRLKAPKRLLAGL
ncbi:MAG: MmcQ/YjbR family DNA-binding protein [Chloroflexota bacterium]